MDFVSKKESKVQIVCSYQDQFTGIAYISSAMQSVTLAPNPITCSSLPRLPISWNGVHKRDSLHAMRDIQAHNLFDAVIADPPYNIGKDFGNNSDHRSLRAYLEWSEAWIKECMRLVKPSAPLYVYGFPEILAHIAVRYPLAQQRWLVWHYTNKTVPSSRFWQRSHESILCLWKGKRPTLDVDAIREDYTDTFVKNSSGKLRKPMNCRYGRVGQLTFYHAHPKGALPRDVLKVPALAGGAGYAQRWFFCKTCDTLCAPKEAHQHRTHEVIRHPTQKPMDLTKRLIQSAAKKGDRILIPFAGSGSECVVAQTLGLHFISTEINQDYVLLANAWLKHVSNERPAHIYAMTC